MKCPLCNNLEDKVLESRQNISGTTIRRRRECLSCNYRFTSYEKVEETPLMVIKRDGRRQEFDIKKMEKGILRAVEKRPVPQIVLEQMINELEDQAALEGRAAHEIEATKLGAMVLERLYSLDKVAYIRFASVYKQFESVSEFIKEIETLTKK